MEKTPDIIDLIRLYQSYSDKAVKIFQEHFNIKNPLEEWHKGTYSQTGELKNAGLKFYAFHGIGLAAHFKNLVVDFDFAFFPEIRWDGFDVWRLWNFSQHLGPKFDHLKKEEKIKMELLDLQFKSVIWKPKLEFSTSLYFFIEDLPDHLKPKPINLDRKEKNKYWWQFWK